MRGTEFLFRHRGSICRRKARVPHSPATARSHGRPPEPSCGCAAQRLRAAKHCFRDLRMMLDRPCRYSFSLAFCAQNAAPAPSAARVVKQSLHFLTLFLPLFLRIEGCIGYGNVFRFCRGGGSSFGVPDMHIQLREGYFDAVLCEQFVHSQADIRHG